MCACMHACPAGEPLSSYNGLCVNSSITKHFLSFASFPVSFQTYLAQAENRDPPLQPESTRSSVLTPSQLSASKYRVTEEPHVKALLPDV